MLSLLLLLMLRQVITGDAKKDIGSENNSSPRRGIGWFLITSAMMLDRKSVLRRVIVIEGFQICGCGHSVSGDGAPDWAPSGICPDGERKLPDDGVEGLTSWL